MAFHFTLLLTLIIKPDPYEKILEQNMYCHNLFHFVNLYRSCQHSQKLLLLNLEH
jgi:hypothetical protein